MRLLKEPLLHFLLLGGLLFALFGYLRRDEAAAPVSSAPLTPSREILVTQATLRSLIEQFEKTRQRSPTEQEFEGLIDEFIREEVLYREALALGLDRDDTIVKRRLRQKLEFITEDLVALAEPTDAELAGYLGSHAEAYRLDPAFTFMQVYLNPKKRAETLETDIESLLAALRSSGASADITLAGDSLMLDQAFQTIPQRDIAQLFGGEFADALPGIPTGSWQGPCTSGYGVHLVYISERTEGRLPALPEVRDAVIRDWSAANRDQANEALYEKWLAAYSVTVEELNPEQGATSP